MDNQPANVGAQTPPAADDPNATRYIPTQEGYVAQDRPIPAATSAASVGEAQFAQPHNTSPPPYQPFAQAQTHGGQTYHGPRERDRTVLGLIFIGGGLLFLLDQVGIFGNLGNLVPLLIGAIFLYAYFTTRPGYRVGFLIPGAILTGIGAGQLIENLPVPRLWPGGDMTVLTLGLGFCLIWVLERKHWWALIPGGILVMVGLSNVWGIVQFWPIALIALGVYLLFDQSRRRPR